MKKMSIFLIALCLIATSAHTTPLGGIFNITVSKQEPISDSAVNNTMPRDPNTQPSTLENLATAISGLAYVTTHVVDRYNFSIKKITNEPVNATLMIWTCCEGYVLSNILSSDKLYKKYTELDIIKDFTDNEYEYTVFRPGGKTTIDYIIFGLFDKDKNFIDGFIAKLNFGKDDDVLAKIKDGWYVDLELINDEHLFDKIAKEYDIDHPISENIEKN